MKILETMILSPIVCITMAGILTIISFDFILNIPWNLTLYLFNTHVLLIFLTWLTIMLVPDVPGPFVTLIRSIDTYAQYYNFLLNYLMPPSLISKSIKFNNIQQLMERINDNCGICMDTLNENNISILQCTHVFHTECVEQWLQTRNVCPKCKQGDKVTNKDQ